jgi:hypothetical protein
VELGEVAGVRDARVDGVNDVKVNNAGMAPEDAAGGPLSLRRRRPSL